MSAAANEVAPIDKHINPMKIDTPMPNTSTPLQVPGDEALLSLMMSGLKQADPSFQPTNYWAAYEPRFMNELKAHGLKDMRRQKNLVFRSFGAVDFVHPVAELMLRNHRLFRQWPFNTQPITKLAERIDKYLSRYIKTVDALDFETYVRLGYAYANEYARGSHARPLSEFSMSVAGNPEGVVEIEGRLYSRQMIQYYLQYAYISRFVNFNDLPVIAELGSGMGRQTEIFFKLHPESAYLLFDIPPQLYVAEQYLQTVFPGKVVSYRETQHWTDLKSIKPGHIHILGNFKMPLLATAPVSLFWNSASFHEMEPAVVQNYLQYVDATCQWAYLAENLKGGKRAKAPGDLGILQVTTLDHYKSGLPSFNLIDQTPVERVNGKPLQDHHMLFQRRV
jgi:putative sugar O-methyltransferase